MWKQGGWQRGLHCSKGPSMLRKSPVCCAMLCRAVHRYVAELEARMEAKRAAEEQVSRLDCPWHWHWGPTLEPQRCHAGRWPVGGG